MQEFDTSSSLTWSDGVVTRIRWVNRDSDTPMVDGVPAREYQRDPETLEVLNRPMPRNPVRCLQVLETTNSICWAA